MFHRYSLIELLFRLSDRQIDSFSGLSHLLRDLTLCEAVESVHVDSTLARFYEQPTDFRAITPSLRPSEGRSKGKALIICNTQGRDHWESEESHARHVLEKQFGLEVSLLYIIQKCKQFYVYK